MAEIPPPPASRPLFVYGTLCALPVLALVLMGDASKESEVSLLVRKGTVCGYRRFSVYNSDIPTVKKRNDRLGFLDGYIVFPLTQAQRRKIDNYEEARDVEEAVVWFNDDEGYMTRTLADIWVWDREEGFLSDDSWDLEKFKSDRLESFLNDYRRKMEEDQREKEEGNRNS